MRQRLAYSGIFVLATLVGWGVSPERGDFFEVRAAACAIGGILIVLVQFLATRPGLVRRFILTAVLVAWCGLSLGWMLVRPLAELPSEGALQGWSTFHYQIGAKYFPELGYTELYEQALAADFEGAHNWDYIVSVRNLKTYAVGPRENWVRSSRWSDQRWQEFKSDLDFLEPFVGKRNWRSIFRDRGYNAPPPSTTLRRALTSFDLSVLNLSMVSYLDLILLFAAFVTVGRVFGPLRAVVGLTWVALFFGNVDDRMIGQPFLHDYLSAMLFAACALRRGRPVLSGILLAYATVMRIFPVILLAGLAWWCVLHWRRNGEVPRLAVRFGLAFVVTSAVLCAVGLGNGRGVDGWKEFKSNVALHSQHHVVGSRRIGFAHLFTVDWSKPPVAEQRSGFRREVWPTQKGASQVLAAVAGVLWLWAVARKRLNLFDTVFGALVLVFFAIVLSRYYWSAACLLMLTGGPARDGPLGGRGPASIAAALFAWSSLSYTHFFLLDTNRLEHYLFVNFAATVLIVGGLSVMIYSARFQRFRADGGSV